jgi:hypothetical protein
VAKLFERLAVEGQLKAQVTHARTDLRKTFESKRHLFEEKRKTYTAAIAGAEPVVEEQSEIQSTIRAELRWIADLWTKALDTSYQVCEGNMTARADVVLDNGTVLLKGVPATALMDVGKRMAELQELLSAVPTLDPAKGFKPAPDRGAGYFKAREVLRTRTRKVQVPLVKYQATVEHPAQVDVISVDEPAGSLLEQEWSALITPAQKADLLTRVEEVRRAITTALQRANTVEVQEVHCGEVLFKYVLGAD